MWDYEERQIQDYTTTNPGENWLIDQRKIQFSSINFIAFKNFTKIKLFRYF